MNTLAERLIWARTRKQMTQLQLAKAAGVAQSTIGNLESGMRQTSRNIAQLANVLDVDALWLAEGKGNPERIPLSRPHLSLVNNVDAVDDNDEHAHLERIRKVTLKLSAGIAGFSVEPAEEDGDSIFFRKGWLAARGYKKEKLVAITVYGASMETGLYDGDTVVVNTAENEPRDGQVFAVNYEGEAIVKRLVRDAGEWWLSSDNPDQQRYPRKRCAGDSCIIIGRVIHKQSERI
jgi:phage repressor protein C with HTH and peptisase S24 domain